MTDEDKPQRGRKGTPPLTWTESLKRRLEPAQDDAREWWKALGTFKLLQQDVAEKRAHLMRLGVVPSQPVLAQFDVPEDVPAPIRGACNDILRKYPHLALFSPGIFPYPLWVSMAYTLCTSWEQGGEVLALLLMFAHMFRSEQGYAAVCRIRWAPNDPARSDAGVLMHDEMHPVFVECLYRDAVPVFPDRDVVAMVVTYSPDLSNEEIDENFKRAKARAAELVGQPKGSDATRRRPGATKTYYAMVDLYQRWLAAGRPGTRDKPSPVPGVSGYSKTLLRQAIKWLDPADCAEIPPE